MNYAGYLRVTGHVLCGGVIGCMAGYALFLILVLNDLIGRGKGLEGIFDYFVALAVFPIAGFILGELGGLLVALRTGKQYHGGSIDPQLLLKQLLADTGRSETR